MSAMVARGGIDLGGTKIQAVLVDGKWNVLGSSRRPTPTTGGPGDVAEQMAETLREAALEAGMAPSELTGGGVALIFAFTSLGLTFGRRRKVTSRTPRKTQRCIRYNSAA